MKQYSITGMSCTACSARIEKAVSAVPGVTACAVSLLTNSMGVDGSADEASIIRAVEQIGYGISPKGAVRQTAPNADDLLADHETPLLKKRLLASVCLLLPLMYLSMGYTMLGLPLPEALSDSASDGLAQLLLSAVILLINRRFFINGYKGLIHRSPNMDTLVSMGAGVSFVYSVYTLFALLHSMSQGNAAGAQAPAHTFYFESAGMILTLITVGKTLEARSKGKTTDALRALMKLKPQKATLVRDDTEITVDIAEVKAGDIFVVRPGETIPVDGIILKGETAVNESSLTGESIPVDKGPGASVFAATINTSGFIQCRTSRVGEDTTLAKIIQLVSDSAATKAPIAKTADKISGIFVPAVLSIAAATFLAWLLTGHAFSTALARAISILVISCPCALGLATPVAIMVGSGVGARNGILFKTAASLESAGRCRIVALDKTGTITSGNPIVTDIVPLPPYTENDLLTLSAALESRSEHPLARSILRESRNRNLTLPETESFCALPGSGLRAVYRGEELLGGSIRFLSERVPMPEELRKQAVSLSERGRTPLAFALGGKCLGLIAAADPIKPESREAVLSLRKMGMRVVMLTGDNARTARSIAQEAGIDEVIAGVLPAGKSEAIRSLREEGTVAMVGDGINDAPALAAADLGIAIGAGSDIAIDSADVVLMNSRLSDVPAAFRLGRRTLVNIRENLFWAFIYNAVCIPLAAGAFGLQMNPMFGAAAMSLSSFCVVSNALRLNLLNIHDFSGYKMKSSPKGAEIQLKEMRLMTRTIQIKGMMCSHCEATVRKALEAIEGVTGADVSHTRGNAIVTLSAPVEDAVLKNAVEAKDFEVTEIL